MDHTYNNETISYALVIKKRKNIGVLIDIYGNIEVHASKTASQESINEALEKRWTALIEKQTELKKKSNGPLERTYDSGSEFIFLGITYTLLIMEDSKSTKSDVRINGSHLEVEIKDNNEEAIQQALKRFYYQQCKKMVKQYLHHYQSQFKTKPRNIAIVDNHINWGTCDSNYNMTFNWKLAMAPQKVLEYVVVHEMCHMTHLNHDRSYWRLVGKLLPDYEERQQWLARSNWKMTV